MANKKSFPPSEKDTKNISLNKLLLNEHFSCDICDIRCLHRTLTGRPSILSKCGRPICFHMNPIGPVSMLCQSEGIQDSDLYSFVLLITFYQGTAKKVNCARNLFGTCLRYFQHMVAIWQREQWCTLLAGSFTFFRRSFPLYAHLPKEPGSVSRSRRKDV